MKQFTFIFCITLNTLLYSQDYIISTGPEDNYYIQYSVPLLTEVYNELNINPKFVFTSFKRSLIDVDKGIADAEAFRASVVDTIYPDIIIVNEPLFYIRIMAYTSNPNLNVLSWNNLAGLKVGIIRGIKLSEEYTKNVDIVSSNTHEEAFKLLVKYRVDVVISGELVADKIISNYPNFNFNKHVLEESPAYHFVNIKHKNLIPELEKAIKKLNKNN